MELNVRDTPVARFTVKPQQSICGEGDCFCSECSAGADLSAEPMLSRVIVSFLLNRIRAQRCGGFSPSVNRTAGSCPRLPAGQLLMLAGVTELLQSLLIVIVCVCGLTSDRHGVHRLKNLTWVLVHPYALQYFCSHIINFQPKAA